MAKRSLTKDLLYDGKNEHLDIARLSALLSVLGYIGVTVTVLVQGIWVFDPLQWGSGWAAICGGNAAWIFARQRYEARIAFSPTERSSQQRDLFDTPRMTDDVY